MIAAYRRIATLAAVTLLLSALWAALAAPAPSTASVRVVSPAKGAVVSGKVTLRAELDLPKSAGPLVVHFFAGETDLGAACPGKPEKEWNTTGWTEKTYQVTARLYRWDRQKKAQGLQLAASQPVQVTVGNAGG